MSVECPICFQKFDSFRGLNGHMNRHRPKRLRAEDIIVPFFQGQIIHLTCPLCSYEAPPIQVGSGFCEDCGEVNAFELEQYCLENHPESVRDIIEDDIDAYNEAEFWLLNSHADFCPAIQSGAFTIEDIEDNL